MAPPSKSPSQAGRFKPRAPRKKVTPQVITSSSSIPQQSYQQQHQQQQQQQQQQPSRSQEQRGDSRGRSQSPGRGVRGRDGREGRGGRDSCGRGRGRGRGGRGARIPLPKGQVFFTGNATQKEASGAGGGQSDLLGGEGNDKNNGDIAPGLNGSVVMPGMANMNLKGGSSRNRDGEGEEVVVGEIQGGGVGSKISMEDGPQGILARTKLGESMFDDEEDNNAPVNAAAYTFDSDSSDEVYVRSKQKRWIQQQQQHNKRGSKDNSSKSIEPHQLPFPIPRAVSNTVPRQVMYECQESTILKEFQQEKAQKHKKHLQKKGRHHRPIIDDIESENESEEKPNLLINVEGKDPPIYSPFLPTNNTTKTQQNSDNPDKKSTSFVEQRKERDSWMLFRFPTRLPRIHPNSTISGMAIRSEKLAERAIMDAVKSSMGDNDNHNNNDDGLDSEEVAQMVAAQTVAETTKQIMGANRISTIGMRGEGYDDTLKDVANGKYGKIVCYESGKMEFVLGEHNEGEDGEDGVSDEIRMLIYEGLQPSFSQQAVVIDPDEAAYIPLGQVKKSLIVVPDVDSAFKDNF